MITTTAAKTFPLKKKTAQPQTTCTRLRMFSPGLRGNTATGFGRYKFAENRKSGSCPTHLCHFSRIGKGTQVRILLTYTLLTKNRNPVTRARTRASACKFLPNHVKRKSDVFSDWKNSLFEKKRKCDHGNRDDQTSADDIDRGDRLMHRALRC